MPPKRKRPAPARATKAPLKALVDRKLLPAAFAAGDLVKPKEVCGACLLPVSRADLVGRVDACAHVFHHECVERWAQTENTCPQCKQRFFWLAAYTGQGKRTALARIRRRDQECEEEDDEAFEDLQCCEKCGEVGDEAALLLCDGMHGTCNAAFHYTCVGLSEVPRGSWFCADCVDRGFDVDAHGNRGKRTRTTPPEAEAGPPTPAPSSASGGSQGASSRAVPEAKATPPTTAPHRVESVTPAPATRRGARSSASVPSQLRLSALAQVSPEMELPSFKATGGGEPNEGLFASYVRRRRARGGVEPRADDSGSFINLNPTYQEDFFGKRSA